MTQCLLVHCTTFMSFLGRGWWSEDLLISLGDGDAIKGSVPSIAEPLYMAFTLFGVPKP